LAGLILMAGGGVKAQSVNQSGLLAAIQAIQQQIAMLEQLLAQMPAANRLGQRLGHNLHVDDVANVSFAGRDVASCVSADGNTYPAIGFKSGQLVFVEQVREPKDLSGQRG